MFWKSCKEWLAYETQVMVSRPRSDLSINLPALRKLDNMLLVSSFIHKFPHAIYYEDNLIPLFALISNVFVCTSNIDKFVSTS